MCIDTYVYLSIYIYVWNNLCVCVYIYIYDDEEATNSKHCRLKEIIRMNMLCLIEMFQESIETNAEHETNKKPGEQLWKNGNTRFTSRSKHMKIKQARNTKLDRQDRTQENITP